jgi:prepilin-type N-terminal cleavage/methylation domain-containing protein/prepilin-type processing-associated H-X9-DG protein
MRRLGRRGFTLAELMVVIAVIALLGAVTLPYFHRVFGVQRQIACMNNLEKIGQAFYTRTTRGAAGGMHHSDIAVVSWQGALLKYLSDDDTVFHCPEDDKEHIPGEGARDKLKQIYIEVFTSGVAGDYGSHAWDVPLDEEYASEWVWRLSQEQFDELSRTSGYGRGYHYAGYQEGADPTMYWFVFEDQGWRGGGDKDYWDIFVKINVSDTEITLTPIRGGAGYNFSLAMGKGEQKKILIKDMKASHGQPYTLVGAFGTGSYGLNSMAPEILEGSKRLLVLDYEKVIARGSDYDELDRWFTDEKAFPTKVVDGETIPAFFRHMNKANVLYGDGGVKSMTFDEIRIDKAASRQRHWNPRPDL